jgi:hypothetical protein
MSNKPLANPNAFNTVSPPWNLGQLDSNFMAIQNTLNDTLTYANYFIDQSAVANSIVLSVPTALTVALAAGTLFFVKIANTNTAAVTLTINSLVAQSVLNPDLSALAPSQLLLNQVAILMFDGTQFQFLGAFVQPDKARTAQEISTSVVPTNYAYPPGNVLRYGADPANVADSTTAIKNALLAMNGVGVVYFPAGTYKVTALITLGSNNALQGAGYLITNIVTTSATAGIFSAPVNSYWRITDLYFNASVTQTAGAFLTTAGITGQLERCQFNKYLTAIAGADNVAVFRDIVFSAGVTGTGVGITVTGYAGGLVLDRLLYYAAGLANQPAYGIQVFSCGALQISDSEVVQQGTCLYVNPGTGQTAASIYAFNTFFDSATIGISLAPSGTGTIIRSKFIGCWTSSHSSFGTNIAQGTGTIDGIDFVDHHAFLNGNNGFQMGASINVNISGGAFCQQTSNSGIAVLSNVSKFSIIGATCGSGYGLTGNTNGIFLSGGHNNYSIKNCNLLGNSSASLAGTGTGPVAWVQDNLGYNPVGASSVTVTASPFTLTAGQSSTTVYVAGGTISNITLAGQSVGTGLLTFRLNPFQALVITYSGAPTMWKSID